MDVYRRAGRGGAGNFYSKQDIAEVDRRVREQEVADLEAQKPTPEGDPLPSDPADPPQQHHHQQSQTHGGTLAGAGGAGATTASYYARSGRGGAGNFVDPVQAAAADIADSVTTTTTTTTSATSSLQQQQKQSKNSSWAPTPVIVPTARYSGRGGAGNFSSNSPVKVKEQEQQERILMEALDSGIIKDISETLPQPPPIYHAHGGEENNGRPKAKGPDLVDM